MEDPSETFEDMRDKCDLYTLLSSGDLDHISAPLEKTSMEPLRRKHKLADVRSSFSILSRLRLTRWKSCSHQRQFYRLVEMILLLNLDRSNKAATTAFRLTVKRRLFSFNREQLSQIDVAERKEKLQETFEGVQRDYERLIAGFKSA